MSIPTAELPSLGFDGGVAAKGAAVSTLVARDSGPGVEDASVDGADWWVSEIKWRDIL